MQLRGVQERPYHAFLDDGIKAALQETDTVAEDPSSDLCITTPLHEAIRGISNTIAITDYVRYIHSDAWQAIVADMPEAWGELGPGELWEAESAARAALWQQAMCCPSQHAVSAQSVCDAVVSRLSHGRGQAAKRVAEILVDVGRRDRVRDWCDAALHDLQANV